MTDRTLLEKAAKAFGWAYTKVNKDGWFYVGNIFGGDEHEWELWNPLNDDGDALRLAVKLCLEVTPAGDYTAVRRFNTNEWITEEWGYDPYDPYAATRRCIVRAAAAIGESMG